MLMSQLMSCHVLDVFVEQLMSCHVLDIFNIQVQRQVVRSKVQRRHAEDYQAVCHTGRSSQDRFDDGFNEEPGSSAWRYVERIEGVLW